MNSKKEVQHVYLVGAKSLGAYGGYETFVYKLTEYHQNKENIKYHVACKANGDGCMDESKFDGVTKINEHEFELHNAHCFKIDVPQIGPAQAILCCGCVHSGEKRESGKEKSESRNSSDSSACFELFLIMLSFNYGNHVVCNSPDWCCRCNSDFSTYQRE